MSAILLLNKSQLIFGARSYARNMLCKIEYLQINNMFTCLDNIFYTYIFVFQCSVTIVVLQ